MIEVLYALLPQIIFGLITLFVVWIVTRSPIQVSIDEPPQLAERPDRGSEPTSEILNCYNDVTVVYAAQRATKEFPEGTNFVDTSLYLKKNIIGLITFVQTQEEQLRQLANEVIDENFPWLNKDDDFVKNIIDDVIDEEELFKPVIIEHCKVIQMKNGRWLCFGGL